jgi:hypothetical protein
MLEIVNGRDWKVVHTVHDYEEGGALSDLTGFVFQSQIRERVATKDENGFFRNKLVADVVVAVDVNTSTITLQLPLSEVNKIKQGIYQIDLIGVVVETGETEVFLDPEEIAVVNRPTLAPGGAGGIEDPQIPVPDFSDQFNDALTT